MTKELEILFDRWREHLGPDARFVADGVVGTDAEYLNSPKKLLFLLKETHDLNGVMSACSLDLRLLFRNPDLFKQNRKTVEKTIAKWARDYWKAFSPNCVLPENPMHAVAVVNLKKTPGGASSSSRIIQETVQRDREYLRRQIEILDPEVIVCGSTFEYLAAIYSDASFHDRDNLVVKYGGRLFVNSYHPAAWATKLSRHQAVLCALSPYHGAGS